MDLSYIRRVEAGFQYPRMMMYGFFAKRTDPPSSSLLFWLPASSFLPSPATLDIAPQGSNCAYRRFGSVIRD